MNECVKWGPPYAVPVGSVSLSASHHCGDRRNRLDMALCLSTIMCNTAENDQALKD